MGVDVESKLAHVSVEAGSENGGLKENGTVPNEPIKFGSHGTEEPVKEDVKKAPAINLPKDAVVEDWPAPQQIHSFYLVKYRTFEDQKLKAKLEQAEKELQKKNQARSQMIDNLRAKRAARSELINERKSLSAERQQFRSQIDEKRKVMEPLQQALGKLRGNNAFGRDRGSIIFSSEAELNDYIKSLQYRIQHESITLNEEKQILREIKQIEGTRDKVIANAAERAKIQESLGEKESIQSQVKLIGVDLDGVRKEQQVLSAKLKEIDDELDAMKKEIGTLEEELTALTQQRDKTFQSIQEFRKQREEGNSSFFQSRKLNLEARQLADKKDVAALRELSETEVDKFVTQWSSNKSFRDDYEKRILQSLDMRQLSKDGRMRNPDEKPLVLPETPNVVPAPEVVVKTTQKASKEDSVPPPQPDASLASKAQKDKNSKQQKDGKKKPSKSSLEVNDLDDDEEIPGVTNLPKDSTPKRVEVDEETLKQMRREEEIAKNKQAIERKKKLAEKAAVKAALKAQKEAEKKLKDRERKAKKKAGVAVTDEPTEDPSEKTSEDAEPEKPEENVEAADEPMKPTTKDRKVGPLRQRPRGAKGSDIHKVILKRKKSTNYWIWAAPAAAVVILLLLAVGYKFYA